jgi:hypothetical protein
LAEIKPSTQLLLPDTLNPVAEMDDAHLEENIGVILPSSSIILHGLTSSFKGNVTQEPTSSCSSQTIPLMPPSPRAIPGPHSHVGTLEHNCQSDYIRDDYSKTVGLPCLGGEADPAQGAQFFNFPHAYPPLHDNVLPSVEQNLATHTTVSQFPWLNGGSGGDDQGLYDKMPPTIADVPHIQNRIHPTLEAIINYIFLLNSCYDLHGRIEPLSGSINIRVLLPEITRWHNMLYQAQIDIANEMEHLRKELRLKKMELRAEHKVELERSESMHKQHLQEVKELWKRKARKMRIRSDMENSNRAGRIDDHVRFA